MDWDCKAVSYKISSKVVAVLVAAIVIRKHLRADLAGDSLPK